tara:strand:- start:223 stop:372 length:150 start_codon:yes stop_codon:yes gene_type:complete
MAIFQAFNNKTKAWVKYKQTVGGRSRILDVKESKPLIKFKGVPIKGKRL